MNLRHFENKARQSWWLVHIEAWRQSGLDRTNYCRQHRLCKCTFDRWLKYLAGEDAGRKHAEYLTELRRQKRQQEREKRLKKRRRLRYAVSTDRRNRALQAFWAMHVEAMSWSGMSVREYAAALHLSPYSLRTWRDRLDDGEAEIDWRAHLHPSARPIVSDITNVSLPQNGLTEPSNAEPPAPAQPGRRFFTDEQKRAIVQDSEAAGAKVSAVARRHGIAPGILFRWRAEFGVVPKRAKFASVELIDGASTTVDLQGLVQPPDGMMGVNLANGRRVFVPDGSDPDAVRAQVERGEITL
jgi:transposase-like protein